jgi:hypothetical protein
VQDWISGKRTLPSETLAYVRRLTGHSAEEWKRPDARTWQVSIASDTPCVGTTKLAAKPAPEAPSTPPAPRAAWAVQLIGDRLESNALSRYAQLQKKYQAILGGREPLLVRTTMGKAASLFLYSVGQQPRQGDLLQTIQVHHSTKTAALKAEIIWRARDHPCRGD